jgi:hypothetical protein
VVARLHREAKGDPPDLKAEMLLGQVLLGEVSAHAAAITMGWRKPPTPYKQLLLWWDRARDEQRAEFEDFIAAWRWKEAA